MADVKAMEVKVNGKFPIRHWVIQSLISLTMGGLVSASLAVIAIKYDMREMKLELTNEIKLHAQETNQRLDGHEGRLDKHDDIFDKAFPRRIP